MHAKINQDKLIWEMLEDDLTELELKEYIRVQLSKSVMKMNIKRKFQNLIFKKYGSNGLFMPDYYSIEGPPFNRDVLDESLFIQVAHAKNHCVVISHYNPSEHACSNNWYIYDSLNNPGYYLNTIKNVLKRINGGSRFIKINHIPVSNQNGSIDCGLVMHWL
ncbi:hypothetical protein BpHYR1_051652 [Brachionus plicatilis]|uniref:Uncharacterized protein n=1 Tax=Brachionus plicatilis TaxID=10195 RepID=A0A3M7PZC3_BRAPC|nr:hypothetical protein BpHYR1_051652 [Brachionus plicatilis]